MKFSDIIPDADTLLALTPEEVAGLIMELVAESDNFHPRLNREAIVAPETIGEYNSGRKNEIPFILIEGWQWLVNEGMVAPKPGDRNGWHYITRKGRKINNRENINAYLSSSILPRQLLHPLILNPPTSFYSWRV